MPLHTALHRTLQAHGLSQRQLARQTGLSLTAVNAIVTRGHWPQRGQAAARAAFIQALRQAGATTAELRALALPLAPSTQKAAGAPTPAAAPSPTSDTSTGKDYAMLLENTPLTRAALKHFGLPRSPFVDDIQTRADVFQSAATRYARAALLDSAAHHGFMALVGESGAGKTTLVLELQERIREEQKDILVIKPYTLGMEASDTKGKTLKTAQIAEAVIYALDPQARLKNTPQARFRQMHELLRASRRAGRRHLLVIDEAHCLPVATLKHLKRFLDELKDGLQRLIGIALIAQPELRQLLLSQNPEVREVMQRCEIVELEPLDADLQAYLDHKFARFGLKSEQVFEPDAFDALRARLIHVPRGSKTGISTCYPLAVHNLVARAMNGAAAAGWPKVDAQCVAGV